ncbi:Ubiquitin carboxyl-terminal hydrolase [Spraguea lophii 42_110]|uniref:Ubiquitin carboxyl-terminal hydrolase n=1 Tax=Spraguea lophii (strain 42_110) TaxID=1358809 RepID=S7XLK7_SPRLO|nr:Ubiquitin carboxyl-terminal hydrolase [Spraguea lophii 42_110]
MKILEDQRSDSMSTRLTLYYYSMDEKVKKEVSLHGDEILFDVIRILFLNEEITLEKFERSYRVYSNDMKLDPCTRVCELYGQNIKVIADNALGGLGNLGNTCFMNSSLQGIFAYKEFSDFLCGDYRISENNNLGTGGRLVKALSDVIKMLKTQRTVRPDEFKRELAITTKKYSDYQEQDAPEFISILLDKIHEDLNISAECKDKKYIFNKNEIIEIFENAAINERIVNESIGDTEITPDEYIEYYEEYTKLKTIKKDDNIDYIKKEMKNSQEDRGDKEPESTDSGFEDLDEIQNEENQMTTKKIRKIQKRNKKQFMIVKDDFKKYKPWLNFLEMNNSFIGKNFYGLLHSKLRCVNCSKESITYDPFLFLTLSIPKKRRMHPMVILTRNLKEKLPMKINIDEDFTVNELKELCKIKYGITGEMLVISFRRNVIEILEDEYTIRRFKRIFVYEIENEKRYVWFTIRINSFIFLNDTFEYPWLIEIENTLKDFKNDEFQEKIHQCLDPYIKNYVNIEKYNFKENIKIENKSIHETNYPIVTLNLKENTFSEIFGNDFKLEENIYVESNNGISIEDCSDIYFKREYLSGDNAVFCKNCKELCSHMKKMDIFYYPKFLIITLKRFTYEYSMEKLNDLVDFQEWFTMENINYKLRSVCNHIELGFGSGHYTTYSKREGDWYCFNDSVVSKLKEMKKENAYILFYERE